MKIIQKVKEKKEKFDEKHPFFLINAECGLLILGSIAGTAAVVYGFYRADHDRVSIKKHLEAIQDSVEIIKDIPGLVCIVDKGTKVDIEKMKEAIILPEMNQ